MGLDKLLGHVAADPPPTLSPEWTRIVPVCVINARTAPGFVSVGLPKLQQCSRRLVGAWDAQPTGAAADLTSVVDGEM